MVSKSKKRHLKLRVKYRGMVYKHHVLLENNFQKIRVPRKEKHACDILIQRKSMNTILSHRKDFKYFKNIIHKQLMLSLKSILLTISKIINNYSWRLDLLFFYCPIDKKVWFYINLHALNVNCVFNMFLNKEYDSNQSGLNSFLHDIKSQNYILRIEFKNFKKRSPIKKNIVINDLKNKKALLYENFVKIYNELAENYNFEINNAEYYTIKIFFNEDFFFYIEKIGSSKVDKQLYNLNENLGKRECLIIMINNGYFNNIFENIDLDNLTFEEMAEHISLMNY